MSEGEKLDLLGPVGKKQVLPLIAFGASREGGRACPCGAGQGLRGRSGPAVFVSRAGAGPGQAGVCAELTLSAGS